MTNRELIDYCNSLGGHCLTKGCMYGAYSTHNNSFGSSPCQKYWAKYKDTPYRADILASERYIDDEVG